MRCDCFAWVTGAIASEPGWRSRFQALIEDKTKDFVGREYVFNAIADFLTNQPNGYFIIEGDPGMGKSAILAEYIYINLERWLHHNLIGYRVKPVYMRFNDRTHQQRPSLILDSELLSNLQIDELDICQLIFSYEFTKLQLLYVLRSDGVPFNLYQIDEAENS
jgi:hypothetical protein